MKKILGILLIVGFFSQVSSAGFIDDIQHIATDSEMKVIKTKLKSSSTIELPNGIIQVINPSIDIGGKNYKFSLAKDTSMTTATTACGMLNKTYVSHKSEYHYYSEGSIYFDSEGGMGIIQTTSYIDILTCQ